MSLIFKRRSVRKFTDEVVPDELIENLLKAGMQAPSSCNSQPWEFIVVSKDKDKDPKLEPKEISVIPWSNIYADMICQTTSTLNVTAQAPGTARINLIHETSSGVVKNIY